ncbi:type II toxin-antitoxin system PemK/MazF family toxin [bacterium]|nr:type II toxin-antitoxin system PemK/MazF family toxin [bacterium]
MIGEIRKVIVPFYDLINNKMSFKSRPALIIAKADNEDFIILPISTITRKNNRDLEYDIEIEPTKYPKLNLQKISYVRTHKQTVIYIAEIGNFIGDLKSNYAELFLEILEKREKFSQSITEQALE